MSRRTIAVDQCQQTDDAVSGQGGPGVRPARLRPLRELHPANFAMVMATGVVAMAASLMGIPQLGIVLGVLNLVLFGTLWILTILRIIAFPREVYRDLTDHMRGVGFFTTVAATSVLGIQSVVIFHWERAATGLWVAALVLWLGLIYTVFAALTVKDEKPTLADGINGGWLVAVVATQSVSRLGMLLLPQFPAHEQAMAFVSLCLWLCGGMLYIWLISLIFYRYTFFRLAPSDLNPPYWINMGAMAISALAGTALLDKADIIPFLRRLEPFLQGFTLLFWATATWWIPMLVILACWRHVYKRLRIRYDPLYWGAVFPLGMYTVSTYHLSRVLDLPFLEWIPRGFVYVALAAWVAAFTGLLRSLGGRQRAAVR